MNTTIWIIQGILAAMFGMSGVMKSTQSTEKLLKGGVSWAARFPISTVRFIGMSELLASLGLILPWALNILPILTPVAASGLVVIMILAIAHHAKHKEGKAIMFNAVLLVLSAVIAICRF